MSHENVYVLAGRGDGTGELGPAQTVECHHGKVNIGTVNRKEGVRWDAQLVGGESKDCGGLPIAISGTGRVKVIFV
jgi:hypothetical protein